MADVEKVTDDRTLLQKVLGVNNFVREYKTPQIHVDKTDEFMYQNQPWPALADDFLKSQTLQEAYDHVKRLKEINSQKRKPEGSVVAFNRAALLYEEFRKKHGEEIATARRLIVEKQAQIKALEGKPKGLANRESALQKLSSELSVLKNNLESLKSSNYHIDLSSKTGTD